MRLALALPALAIVSLALTVPAAAQLLPSADDNCASVIDRWQGFAARENQGGHMDPSVFEKIQSEIDRASELCRSGHEAQAVKAIDQSRRRHGY